MLNKSSSQLMIPMYFFDLLDAFWKRLLLKGLWLRTLLKLNCRKNFPVNFPKFWKQLFLRIPVLQVTVNNEMFKMLLQKMKCNYLLKLLNNGYCDIASEKSFLLVVFKLWPLPKSVLSLDFWAFGESQSLFINKKCFHHIKTSQLVCSANQLTGFYMMAILVDNGNRHTDFFFFFYMASEQTCIYNCLHHLFHYMPVFRVAYIRNIYIQTHPKVTSWGSYHISCLYR